MERHNNLFGSIFPKSRARSEEDILLVMNQSFPEVNFLRSTPFFAATVATLYPSVRPLPPAPPFPGLVGSASHAWE